MAMMSNRGNIMKTMNDLLERLDERQSDLRQARNMVRDAEFDVREAKADIIKVLVEDKAYDCLNVDIRRVNNKYRPLKKG